MFGLVRLYGLVYHKLGYALYHFRFDMDFKMRLYRLSVVSGKKKKMQSYLLKNNIVQTMKYIFGKATFVVI